MLTRTATVLFGLVCIGILTPLTQFLTLMTVNSLAETATPVAWAVGFVFSLVLVVALVRYLTRLELIGKQNLVLLYCMLTIAVPLMNIGLVRQVVVSITIAQNHYQNGGNNTYRTIFNSLNPRWFPIAPRMEGLAWAKADFKLAILVDTRALRERQRAAQELEAVLRQERQIRQLGLSLEEASALRMDDTAPSFLLQRLGLDEINSLLVAGFEEEMAELGLLEIVEHRLVELQERSKASFLLLRDTLTAHDDLALQLTPGVQSEMEQGAVQRTLSILRSLPEERQAQYRESSRILEQVLPDLRAAASSLGRTEYGELRRLFESHYLSIFQEGGPRLVQEERNAFLFRLTREQRERIISQTGAEGPNMNLVAFTESIWPDLQSQQIRDRNTVWQNLNEARTAIPWEIWAGPLVHWSALLAAIFLFLMCLAEWFRRKWVDRENLAFPLVEVADHLIRHEYRLELASDLTQPERRRRQFFPPFLVGIGVGFAIISAEAASHYGIVNFEFVMNFNVSERLFTQGALKQLPNVMFVLSPIVVGLVYLVSLQMGFSIWMTFLIYELVHLFFRLSGVNLVDGQYTGWAGGVMFPFPGEQLLGATLIFAIFVVIKSFAKEGTAKTTPDAPGGFLPHGWMTAGLLLLPLAIAALFWDMGLTHLPFLALVSVFVLAQTIAAARVRAETGLPTLHTSYAFTKFPIIFGMTGWTGANVFAVFASVVFLPMTLLFRTLPQHLENLELARRYRLSYKALAASSLAAFFTAIGIGVVSFLVLSYYHGQAMHGSDAFPDQGPFGAGGGRAIASYPFWVSHFLGEAGLNQFTSQHWIRLYAILTGGAVVGLLVFLRAKFLKFPIHPIGYLLLLLSVHYEWVSPVERNAINLPENSWLWGSAFAAWLLKKLIIKYGGMNAYKRAKPWFIGLVAGSVLAIFAWNLTDLMASLYAASQETPEGFVRFFINIQPYNPTFY